MSNSVIYKQFEKTAEQYPEQTAIIEEGRSFTYADLERRISIIMENFPLSVVRKDPLAGGFLATYAPAIAEGNLIAGAPIKAEFVGIVADHGIDQIASIFCRKQTDRGQAKFIWRRLKKRSLSIRNSDFMIWKATINIGSNLSESLNGVVTENGKRVRV